MLTSPKQCIIQQYCQFALQCVNQLTVSFNNEIQQLGMYFLRRIVISQPNMILQPQQLHSTKIDNYFLFLQSTTFTPAFFVIIIKSCMIKQLSQSIAEELCAQQVITSLPDCIKELVDNSIDAGSTYIKIILHQYGKHKIQIIDNGFGIDNFDFLGKKGSTSKNKGNDQFNYLGFRGEAIHSIGRVSKSMIIQSKCFMDGFRRVFNVNTNQLQVFKQERLCHSQFNFQVTNKQNSRNTGTKVTIEDIFKNLPVRHIELHSKCKQFLKRTNQLIKQFCFIYPEIQFIFINTREGKPQIIIETTAHKCFSRTTWLQRIKELDDRVGSSLVYIHSQLFQGFVLGKIESGSSRENNFIKKNQHYLFINRRPIDIIGAIQSTMNEIYKKYNNNTKYIFFINLKLDHNKIDVNLTPNKRQIFIRKEILQRIVKDIRQQITEKVVEEIPTLSHYEEKKKSSQPQPSYEPIAFSQVESTHQRKTISFPIQRREESLNNGQERIRQNASKTSQKDTALRQSVGQFKSSVNWGQQSKKELIINKPSKALSQLPQLQKINIDKQKLKQKLNSRLSINFANFKKPAPVSENPTPKTVDLEPVNSQELQHIRKQNQQKKLRQQQQDAKRRAQFLKQVKIQYHDEQNEKKIKLNLQKYNHSTTSKNKEKHLNLMQEQVRRGNYEDEGESYNRIKSKINIDMSQIFNKFNSKNKPNLESQAIKGHTHQDQANKSSNLQQREAMIIESQEARKQKPVQESVMIDSKGNVTNKSLKKQHFKQFQVIGQFNMGFILCVFNHQYFLVDQHAASQKYHYQSFLNKSLTLQSIKSQQKQQITGIEADEIEDSKILLTEAGFYYQIIDRRILQLERCPVFNQVKLGLQYFWQIVEQKKELHRIQKFTAMCAMRACKTAVVVGNPLRYNEMKQIVSKLADLQSPWNCPHGRPTLVQLGK